MTDTTIKERFLALLAFAPGLTDREATDRLLGGTGKPPQALNALARSLETAGLITRGERADGRIGNYVTTGPRVPARPDTAPPATHLARPPESSSRRTSEKAWPSEDGVKALLLRWLEADGWTGSVQWGHDRGIDMDVRRGTERWVIEVKGGGSLQPMRVNYFLCILGETLQRMSDPASRYSIALPDMAQFRGLWSRLPALARERTQITALFVTEHGVVSHEP